MQTKKIAFLRPAAYPLPNQILPDLLAKAFPEYSVEIIDLKALMRKQPRLLLNLLAMLREYGLALLKGQIKAREAFYTTRYSQRVIAQLVEKKINPQKYAFSFQIQSLFDASSGRVPHFVYTDHTHLARLTYANFDPRKLRPQHWINMETGIYQHASLNFTRSTNIAKSLHEQYAVPANKIVVAGAGINIDIQHLKNDKADYSNKNILFVGIDWERKGGPDLLSAFEIVLQKHPTARLTIVGSSPQTRLPNCTITGKIALTELGPYFEDASIFCLPTKMEPFGVAFIEALYYQLPIVATNIGAIPDFVKHAENGYLVEPGDVTGLARWLDALLCNPQLCKKFGQRGYALALESYSWPAVSQKLSTAIRAQLNSPAAE